MPFLYSWRDFSGIFQGEDCQHRRGLVSIIAFIILVLFLLQKLEVHLWANMMWKFLKNVVINLFVKYLYSILWKLFISRADFNLIRRGYLVARGTSTISSFLYHISSNDRMSIVSNSEVRAPLSPVLVGVWKLCCFVSYYRNCLLNHAIEREIEGRTEVTERRRRRKQLLDDRKGPRGYCILKEEALDRILLRTRFGRGWGPVIRRTMEWMSEWMSE